ncbi:MAG: (2,3-dihydroxybenzoyl)adenylate synthase [Acidobacteria bacterium]|nr:(2,3-dihydroxybenzoyl)adenylate synthase [Acidobacteriota bacterium]
MLEGCTPYPAEVAERYKRDGIWQPQTLGELLEETTARFPEHFAVAAKNRRINYSELNQLSDRLALHLLDQGLRPRDIVLLQLPNVWEFNVVFFALMKIGVMPVLCLPPHRQAELTYFAQLTGATGYFVAPEFRGCNYIAMAREIQAAAPALRHVFALGTGVEPDVKYLAPMLDDPLTSDSLDLRTPTDSIRQLRPDPYDVAFFLLSGGTTGIPKLIPRTHADYIYNARVCAEALGWESSMVFMVVIPAEHNFPLGAPGMVGALSVGGSVAMSLTPDPATVFEAIQRDKGTFLALSPALLIMLLNSPEREKYDLNSLRFVCAGGQKMLPELVDRTRATWPWVTVGHAFGMAEGLINLTRPNDSLAVIRETQGRPASPHEEIRVVDDEGHDVAPGEVGELITRGPYTICGYYKAEEHNQSAFTTDGFYRTGDMVRLHAAGPLAGNVSVEGRKKDMINRGGEKISAEEIENLILGHDSVHMIAVVAMPDAVMGEKSCAFVIPRPGRTLALAELCAFLVSRNIAKFKLPERLELVEAFPLTHVGKVSKKDLRVIIADKMRAEARA